MSRIDKFLISHCSPTLANLKTAGLFNYAFSTEDGLEQCLLAGNLLLNGKGVFLETLRVEDSQALILVYRKSKLKEDLQKNGVAEFLFTYGYQSNSVEACLRHIKHRLGLRKEFPHEIGVFLGYPLEDVAGFIKNGGQNCKCTGCWKVYGNECEAMRLFARYRKCRDIYQKLFTCGKSVLQLTVAA